MPAKTVYPIALTEPEVEILASVLSDMSTQDPLALSMYDALGAVAGTARCFECGRMMFPDRLPDHPCAEWKAAAAARAQWAGTSVAWRLITIPGEDAPDEEVYPDDAALCARCDRTYDQHYGWRGPTKVCVAQRPDRGTFTPAGAGAAFPKATEG